MVDASSHNANVNECSLQQEVYSALNFMKKIFNFMFKVWCHIFDDKINITTR